MYDDTQRYLNKAEPLARSHSAEISNEGRLRAKLYGHDADELNARARNFAARMNWQAAEIVMTAGQASPYEVK